VVSAVSNGTLTRQASIPLVSVRYLNSIPNGNRVVAMSDTATNPVNPGGPTGRVWIITPSLIGSGTQPYTEVVSSLFDHPVFAVGSTDNTTAYVLNCGPECGGTQAGIVTIDLASSAVTCSAPPCSALPVPSGATVALLNANMLYVAGTVAGVGGVTPVDLVTSTLSPTIPIADGYHDRIALGANNLLFVGARGCTITITPPMGCLTLVSNPNSASQKVTIAPPAPFKFPAPDPGDDVTGIAPIQNRNEVYVIQGGELIIYDTTIMARKVQDNPPDIVGQAVDVVALD